MMRAGETMAVLGWVIQQLMRIVPGRITEWIIRRGTERIGRAANAIQLKDYSSFVKAGEAATR
jgi:hypothetical protein